MERKKDDFRGLLVILPGRNDPGLPAMGTTQLADMQRCHSKVSSGYDPLPGTPTLDPRDEYGSLDMQGRSQLAKNGNGRRRNPLFDLANIPRAQAHTVRQFLLRHIFGVTESTQINRHDLFEIHGGIAL